MALVLLFGVVVHRVDVAIVGVDGVVVIGGGSGCGGGDCGVRVLVAILVIL